MKDSRTHIRVHNGIVDHPKVEALSDGAFRMMFELWCWCSRHLTDGAVSKQKWIKSGSIRRRNELITAGIVEANSDGSVHMHDYEKHQNTAAEVADIQDKKAYASSLANHTKWHLNRGVTSPDCKHCVSDPTLPDVSHLGDGEESVADPKPIPNVSLVHRTEGSTEKTSSSSVDARKRAHALPADFAVTDAMKDWVRENCPHVDAWHEFEQFTDHWHGNGKPMKDWLAVFRKWMREAERRAVAGNGNGKVRQLEAVADHWDPGTPPDDVVDDPAAFREWHASRVEAHKRGEA